MPTKEEQLLKIEADERDVIKKTEVYHLINNIGFTCPFKPSSIRKGDVYMTKTPNVHKYRPFVVIKVLDTTVYSLPLSRNPGFRALNKLNSRFFNDTYITNTLINESIENVTENYVLSLDNNLCVNEAIRRLKIITNKL